MRVKKYDYLINGNGDIWMVMRVHRSGAVTMAYNGEGTGEDELLYSSGEIDSFFRKLPGDDYSGLGWLDPKPYWSPSQDKPTRRTKRAKGRSTVTATVSGIGR